MLEGTISVLLRRHSNRESTFVMARAEPLIELWSRHSYQFHGFDHSHNDPQPWGRWFHLWEDGEPDMFEAAYCGLSDESTGLTLNFSNGRHRTRWLLDAGWASVPIELRNSALKTAKKEGLIERTVSPEERVSLPVFDYGLAEKDWL